MRAVDIITKKRDNITLTKEEIEFFLKGYMSGDIPDYQMSSLLMAIYYNGLSTAELGIFTDVMTHSGYIIDPYEGTNTRKRFLIDKHSTGGVGDKTTISLIGMLGSLGIGELKLSGRGLGFTGGTVDKFESIPGFRFPQTRDEMISMLNDIGTGIMAYTDGLVPLDKKIYALRDVTGTVESIPLIASSIMSKKLALKSDCIILDVKVGSGAFMKSEQEARKLANTMLDISKACNRKAVAILSNMDEPLGYAIGNANEVCEAIDTIKGKGPRDFTELVVTLAAVALISSDSSITLEKAKTIALDAISSGKALSHFQHFLEYTSADPNIINDYSLLPQAKYTYEYKTDKSGYISKIDAESIGKAAMILGAGRATKDDNIDYAAGIVLRKKVCDFADSSDILAILQYNDKTKLASALSILDVAYEFSQDKPAPKSTIIDIING